MFWDESRYDAAIERNLAELQRALLNRRARVSVPSLLNGLIGLKDDKGRRRIGYPASVFRRSTLY